MRLDPSSYDRRILVGVTGLTPQVVTETVYALAVEREPPFIPTEIHILTSNTGAKAIQSRLLSEGEDRFGQLCREYALGYIKFDASCIHILKDDEGCPLEDIQTPEQQTWAADTITGLIQTLTRDDTAALHVSLAGGRKSMGFYMGYALSLFGRPQDRLSHVLVSAPFENVTDFFYPPRSPAIFKTRDEVNLNSADAKIMLADIPFVQMRSHLPLGLQREGARFSDAVEAVGVTVGPPSLVFDQSSRQLQCGGIDVHMEAYPLALYLWLARRAVRGEPGISHRTEVTGFLEEYGRLIGRHSGAYVTAEKCLANGFDKSDFRSKISLVKKALVRALGTQGAKPWLIDRTGQRGYATYTLSLTGANIHFKTESRTGGLR